MIRIGMRVFCYCLSFVTFAVTTVRVVGENAPLSITPKISQLKARAERGFVQQEIELANAYFVGDGVPQDVMEAAHWYERAAESGHPGAQNQIGYFYEAGIGVPVNLERSAHWYQIAAASGSALGALNLGAAYLKGRGVAKNEAMAASCLLDAFHKGSGTAAAYLGDMYYFGVGESMDRTVAEKWYEAGVKLHDPMAGYRLGTMYSTADDHVHSSGKAAELLRESSKGGYVLAMQSLGLLLVNEPKLAKSDGEAQQWLEEAANAGNWRSSIVLGILARDGKAGPVDYETAYFHFLVAARQGGQQAKDIVANDLKNIGARVGRDEDTKLVSIADDWFTQHSVALKYIATCDKDHSLFPAVAIAATPPGAFVGQLVPLTSPSAIKSCVNCR